MKQPNAELTFDMSLPDELRRKQYIPLYYSSAPPDIKLCRNIAIEMMNLIAGSKHTHKYWEDSNTFEISWRDKKNQNRSVKTSYRLIINHLLANRTWPKQLSQILTSWMDSSVLITMNFQALSNEDSNLALTFKLPPSMGNNFPIVPSINREGVAFSSMQSHLQKMLLLVRKKTVEKSHLIFDLGSDWLENLISFLNTSVSVVETTLHELYYKAKYDGTNMGWQFDENKLGSTFGRRVKDKIKWVYKITGKKLDDIGHEIKDLETIKNVRNHFNHFDPPVMAFSIEDIAQWLNTTKNIAMLLWKIRRRIGVPLSSPLIELLLCPDVEWSARDPNKRRIPSSEYDGYASCRWPSEK